MMGGDKRKKPIPGSSGCRMPPLVNRNLVAAFLAVTFMMLCAVTRADKVGKVAFCLEERWPQEAVLLHDGVPVTVLFLEAEGGVGNNEEYNNDLVVLAAFAFHGMDDLSGDATRILPEFECHFQDKWTPTGSSWRRHPIHRSSAKLEVLAENKKLGDHTVSAKIICGQPMGEPMNLRWQLALASNISTRGGMSWIQAPSLPLCALSREEKVWPLQYFFPISVDDYGSRGEDAKALADESTEIALCVAPSTWSDPWNQSSIRDWIFYQRHIVGFTKVFYLDPNGDEIHNTHPYTTISDFGMDLLLFPHTSARKSLSAALKDEGAVGESLSRERCAMLARQRGIEYMHYVRNPMDLIVPMQRRREFLPKAIAAALGDGCAERIHLSKVMMSFSGMRDHCGEPCDTISRFLMNGKPILVEEPKETDSNSSSVMLWRVTQDTSPSGSLCKDSASISSNEIVSTEIQDEEFDGNSELNWILSDIGVWARVVLKANDDAFTRKIAQKRSQSILAAASSGSRQPMSFRMCNHNELGPYYAEGAVFRRLGQCQNRSCFLEEELLHLTFYSAEVVIHDDYDSLKISVLAEDKDSREFTLYNSSAWGVLHQTFKPLEILPEINCVFFHADPEIHLLKGELRSPAKWIQHGDVLLWLECPLPPTVESPSRVTVEIATQSENDYVLHMIRAISLCGGESTSGVACDKSSIACNVGCIDEGKDNSDPQAKCCNRCNEEFYRYMRYDERDFWIPISESQNAETENKTTDKESSLDRYLAGRDLSICLRPFFLDTICVECDGQEAISPQRLIEWIEYHVLIGFDKIYVLDRYGGSLLPILDNYIQSGRVIHVPFPFLSDTSLSSAARSEQSKIVPSAHDQVLAYDYCLSEGRLRNDAFMAFMDTDEFIRYPTPRAGMLRSVMSRLLSRHWNSTDLPDSISLDRFDVEVEPYGLALGYTQRSLHRRTHRPNGETLRHGKVLGRPSALQYGAIWVHDAYNSSGSDWDFRNRFPGGQNALIAPAEELSIYHYRQKDNRAWIATPSTFDEPLVSDSSLRWAYDIISSQFVATPGWKAAYGLWKQGHIRLMPTNKAQGQTSLDDRPSLFIGLLSYCSNRDRRDAIRQTWLSRAIIETLSPHMHVEFRFILGLPSRSERNRFCTSRSVREEASTFGDLLIMENVPESYQVLTRKSMAMIKWASDNLDPDFIFKTDDDSYVDLTRLVETFLQVESPDLPLYFGGKIKSMSHSLSTHFDASPEGRWYTKPENLPVDAQRYVVGAGYALSRPLAKHVSNMINGSSFEVPWGPENEMGWLEDGAIGYLLRGAANRAGRIMAWDVNDLWYRDRFQCDFGDLGMMVLHHLDASQQYDAHHIFSVDQNTWSDHLCNRLKDAFSGVYYKNPNDEQRKRATSWESSFLERPLPPLMTTGHALISSSNHNTSVGDLDVLVITGGCGNIGKHLVRTFQRGYSRIPGPFTIVVVDSLDSTSQSCSFPLPTEEDPYVVTVEVIRVDIRNYDEMHAVLEPYAPRIRGLIHLAAIARVRDCASNTTACMQVNVDGTNNIMRLLWAFFGTKTRSGGRQVLPWLLFASSREVYGELGPHDIVDEKSRLQPVNSYGESKLQAEQVLRMWAHKTKFNVVTLRFTNVYGSCDDNMKRLVPQWTASLSSEKEVRLTGSSDKTVSLLHVQDAVQGISLALRFATTLENAAGYYEAFNIGGGASHDVLNINDIFHTLQSAVSNLHPGCKGCRNAPTVDGSDSGVHEPDHYRGSIDKAFRVLGYQPSRTFNVQTMQEYIQTCGFLDPEQSLTTSRERSLTTSGEQSLAISSSDLRLLVEAGMPSGVFFIWHWLGLVTLMLWGMFQRGGRRLRGDRRRLRSCLRQFVVSKALPL